jgi:hypothetical protein
MPTNHSPSQENLENRVSQMEYHIDENIESLCNEFTTSLDHEFNKLVHVLWGNNVDTNPK